MRCGYEALDIAIHSNRIRAPMSNMHTTTERQPKRFSPCEAGAVARTLGAEEAF